MRQRRESHPPGGEANLAYELVNGLTPKISLLPFTEVSEVY
ncbi:unnamed protein product, partial [marine sediment metagenome]